MTTISSGSAPTSPPPDREPLLTIHAAVVLVMAAIVGATMGVLTFFSAGNAAAALLAGFTGFGASALGLDKVVGR
ncbi:hypothetical protein ACFWZZ_10875 [[Kitasatospora] papulosa]|uniref:hypothetical protein n=1 Tax=[Kitasatospora] papulosa TaxID=1464011 RepID=UPI00368F2D34